MSLEEYICMKESVRDRVLEETRRQMAQVLMSNDLWMQLILVR